MSKEISILSLNCHQTDTLISSTTETLLSRHQIPSRPRLGTSTKSRWPSRLDWTINQLTSKMLVRPTTCKSGAPTQDGSKFSSLYHLMMVNQPQRLLLAQLVSWPLNQPKCQLHTAEASRPKTLWIKIRTHSLIPRRELDNTGKDNSRVELIPSAKWESLTESAAAEKD